jgi:hypothetical protein
MHHDDLRRGKRHMLGPKAIELEVFVGGNWGLMLALELNAQHHDDVDAANGFAHVVGQLDAGAMAFNSSGKSEAGPQRTMRAPNFESR